MTPREVLEAVLTEHAASWSNEDKEIVALIIATAATLSASIALGGPEASDALVHLKAQMANVSAAAAQNAANIARATIERILLNATSIAIKGLGLLA